MAGMVRYGQVWSGRASSGLARLGWAWLVRGKNPYLHGSCSGPFKGQGIPAPLSPQKTKNSSTLWVGQMTQTHPAFGGPTPLRRRYKWFACRGLQWTGAVRADAPPTCPRQWSEPCALVAPPPVHNQWLSAHPLQIRGPAWAAAIDDQPADTDADAQARFGPICTRPGSWLLLCGVQSFREDSEPTFGQIAPPALSLGLSGALQPRRARGGAGRSVLGVASQGRVDRIAGRSRGEAAVPSCSLHSTVGNKRLLSRTRPPEKK